jgi:hypothetical protein
MQHKLKNSELTSAEEFSAVSVIQQIVLTVKEE